MKKVANNKSISVVVPAYNESKIINRSAAAIVKAITKIQANNLVNNYEIIFVDDGSKDNTWNLIRKMHLQNSRIIGVRLSRNFGIHTAITAGLEKSNGEYTVILECDLQDPPDLIEKMLRQLIKTKSDVISGKRISRSESVKRQLLFKAFHFIFHNISNIKVPQNVGTFSIINRKALTALLCFKEKNRYLPALRYLVGYKQTYYKYYRLDRKDSSTKMNTTKLLSLASDAIFSFTDFPLKLCFTLGVVGTFISLVTVLYAMITRLLNFNVITGWSSTLFFINFFGSLQLIFLGVIGEYIYKIYIEVKNRPTYFVSEVTT